MNILSKGIIICFLIASDFPSRYVPFFKFKEAKVSPRTKTYYCDAKESGSFDSLCSDGRHVRRFNWEEEIEKCHRKRCEASPYCAPHTFPSFIMKVNHGYVVSSGYHIKNEIFTHEKIIADTHSPFYHGSKSILSELGDYKVIEVKEELASPGITYRDGDFTHFTTEVLPQLIRLFHSLPEEVVVLWPSSDIAKSIYNDLILNEILSSTRQVIFQESKTIYRAKELYFHHFRTREAVASPVNMMLANKVLTTHFAADAEQNHIKSILIVDRKRFKTRKYHDHDRLVKELTRIYNPRGFEIKTIDPMDPNVSFMQLGKAFWGASLVIAPHSSSISNVLFSKSCSSILEIGWVPFSDQFYCYSRNLGFDYSFMLSLGNGKTEYLSPNFEDVLDSIKILIEESKC